MKAVYITTLWVIAGGFFGCKSAPKNDCVANPKEGCACAMIYQPVCGCDGKTYGNACEAGCAGVRVVSEGACK